jgi:hypothetical protein
VRRAMKTFFEAMASPEAQGPWTMMMGGAPYTYGRYLQSRYDNTQSRR